MKEQIVKIEYYETTLLVNAADVHQEISKRLALKAKHRDIDCICHHEVTNDVLLECFDSRKIKKKWIKNNPERFDEDQDSLWLLQIEKFGSQHNFEVHIESK